MTNDEKRKTRKCDECGKPDLGVADDPRITRFLCGDCSYAEQLKRGLVGGTNSPGGSA